MSNFVLNDSTNDSRIPWEHEHSYAPGTQLILTPHIGPNPFGIGYDVPDDLPIETMGLSKEEETFSRTRLVFETTPHKFDAEKQNDKASQCRLEILEWPRGGGSTTWKPGARNILCKVTKPAVFPQGAEGHEMPKAGDFLFIKVFDPLFWPRILEIQMAPFKVTTQADMAFSKEAGIYRQLHKKGLTGYPNLAPRFHGTWTIELTTNNPDLQGRSRHVAAILTEYIDGAPLPRLFVHNVGPILSPTKVSDQSEKQVELSESLRLDVMGQILGGLVHQFQAGIDAGLLFELKSIMISLVDGPNKLEKPRAVLVDYASAVVYDFTKPRDSPHLLWSKPPHPWRLYGMENLDQFIGWLPVAWNNKDDPECDPEWNVHLNCWMLDTFGELDDDDSHYAFLSDAENAMADACSDDVSDLAALDTESDLSDSEAASKAPEQSTSKGKKPDTSTDD